MVFQTDVVLIHWNQPETLVDTANRFIALVEVASVYVVDNGSTQENLERLRATIDPTIRVIEVGFNSGFGPAANRGWEAWLEASNPSPWCVVAPHDAIAAPDTLQKLLDAAMDNPDVGLLSADVGDQCRPFVDHVFGPILKPAAREQGYEAVDYPHGTLMMISRRCAEVVGLFDERYFAYCEEADLGLRAQKAGFAVGLVRGAMVENPMVSTPAPMAEYLMERNTVLLIRDHFGRRKAAMRYGLMIGQLIAYTLIPSRRTPYWSAKARRLAIADVARRSWGPPPEAVTTVA